MGKTWKRCALCFAASLALALALLLLGACLPQAPIDQHFGDSIALLTKEGDYPHMGGDANSFMLDNFTDAQILMQSVAMRGSDIASVLTNPKFVKGSPVAALEGFLANREGSPTSYYVRYWMGFRTPMRLLLTFLNYGQIRSLLGYAFLGLFVLVTCFVARWTDLRAGVAFALSVVFVKPQIICLSPHYSCCFLLAMLAMLCVPKIASKKLGVPFFFTVGTATMYFDFYTTPLVTLGYPLLLYLLLNGGAEKPVKRSLCFMAAWLAGYAGMWVAKLALTSLLTPVDGMANGFASFASRVGIHRAENLQSYYSVVGAFKAVITETLSSRAGVYAFVGLVALTALTVVIGLRKKRVSPASFKRYAPLLLPACAVVLWFVVAAQPTYIHAFFQYRSVALIYFAVGLYLSLLFVPLKSANPSPVCIHREPNPPRPAQMKED